jgi:subtilisin family serine protease
MATALSGSVLGSSAAGLTPVANAAGKSANPFPEGSRQELSVTEPSSLDPLLPGPLDPILRLLAERGKFDEALAELSPPTLIDGRPGVELILLAERDLSAELLALGGRPRSAISGSPWILTADLPLASLSRLSRLPGLISAHAAAPIHRRLDRSLPESRVPQAWIGGGPQGSPLDGSGVLVALVDSGLDYRHPSFAFADGSPRLAGVWDQRLPGSPPEGFDYGHLCDNGAIADGSCPHRDLDGHGTHVLGIAAGGGAGGFRSGVAPGADLLVVADDGDDASVIDAWSWIVDVATANGLPVVINNSFGSHRGAHDGSSPLAQAIDALSGPGVAFVVAAGNEFEQPIHAEGQLTAGSALRLEWAFPEPSDLSVSLLELWYGAGDDFSVSLVAADGSRYGPVPRGDAAEYQVGEVRASIDARPVQGHPDGNTVVLLEWPDGRPAQGRWAVELEADAVSGEGIWDAWLPEGRGAGGGSEGFVNHQSPQLTLVDAANADLAITVAAYVSRDCWPGADDEYCIDPLPQLGAIAAFSSAGPTRDGRRKPDVAAPGQAILAPRSSASETDPPDTSADGLWVHHDGTSMAAPHVAGAIALLLEIRPNLSPSQIQEILWATARRDGATGDGDETGWDARWGAGKLDVGAAAELLGFGLAPYAVFLPLVGGL